MCALHSCLLQVSTSVFIYGLFGFASVKTLVCFVECRVCLARFKDCPLCGADIESIEADENLQKLVDQFIEGHARIKRSLVNSADKEDDNKKVIYADVSMERGSFLVQQAMRVSFVSKIC